MNKNFLKLIICVTAFFLISCSTKVNEISHSSSINSSETFITLKRKDIALGTIARVKLDGKKLGSLVHGKGMKISLSPGGHNLELSEALTIFTDNYNFTIKEGETINFTIGYLSGFFVKSVN